MPPKDLLIDFVATRLNRQKPPENESYCDKVKELVREQPIFCINRLLLGNFLASRNNIKTSCATEAHQQN